MNLNLARKWRSKNFDQIVGQELSVKMLKNSLYLGNYFPVYLFSGQRGSGKTSLARIFAAAVNCSALSDFQKKPTIHTVPCLSCQSCHAMSNGSHPDFVEIDAASHTGVDMIRQIIDASNLLPLMGSKKVYLIDEAHMLSKASFNALLKVLEEPPQSVLFILATTDHQKIIDTVRSRCFQLFFKSIEASLLVRHLQDICEQESIVFDLAGLSLIVDETQGSARDAINMLEQVRFSSSIVSKDAVLQVLGHMSDEKIIALLDLVLRKPIADLLVFLQDNRIESCSIEFLYKRFSDVIRAALWLKHGVAPDIFKNHLAEIGLVISSVSVVQLNSMLELLYANELVFNKAMAKYSLFEMILLQLAQKDDPDVSMGRQDARVVRSEVALGEELSVVVEQTESEDKIKKAENISGVEGGEQNDQACWQAFVSQIEILQDPLLLSVFSQGYFISLDRTNGQLQVAFTKDLLFFKDWLDKTVGMWHPLLNKAFSGEISFEPLFTLEKKKEISEGAAKIDKRESRPVELVRKSYEKSHEKSAGLALDISDSTVWQKTNMILRYFPGTVTEIKEQHTNRGGS